VHLLILGYPVNPDYPVNQILELQYYPDLPVNQYYLENLDYLVDLIPVVPYYLVNQYFLDYLVILANLILEVLAHPDYLNYLGNLDYLYYLDFLVNQIPGVQCYLVNPDFLVSQNLELLYYLEDPYLVVLDSPDFRLFPEVLYYPVDLNLVAQYYLGDLDFL
jgi:hypothetical protein